MAPRSMIPSMPRLRTPARSLKHSPSVARSSGVEMRTIAAKKPTSKSVESTSSMVGDAQPVHQEQTSGHHREEGNALDDIGEIDRHAGRARHRAGAVEDDGEEERG